MMDLLIPKPDIEQRQRNGSKLFYKIIGRLRSLARSRVQPGPFNY